MTHYNSPKNREKPTNVYLAFLRQLEKYQNKTEKLDYDNCTHLKQLIQHYYDTQYQYYYGSTVPYYSNYPTVPPELEQDSMYQQWQNLHEIDPSQKIDEKQLPKKVKSIYNDITKLRVNRKREKVKIYADIHNMSDLLKLIENNPYDSSKEYSIDLKALHKIKTEIEQINSMIGLETVKTSILRQLMYFMQGFTEDPHDSDYKHTIFTGPPGTGKTEIAKLVGQMYSKIGILKNNVFKKVTRTDLVAGYLGQTAIKTQKVLDECAGGVLFLDEAYSLQTDDMFAKECVDTLCEALSDRKQDLMVIIAGYNKELDNTFFRINPGIKSRFLWRFNIEAYEIQEMFAIFQYISDNKKWKLCPSITIDWFESKNKHFQDNGRSMEQLFSYSKISHAQRIYGKEPTLRKILTKEDLEKGFELYEEYGHCKKDNNIYLGLYT